jgi:uncharacterized protein YbaR (Trm112 family)
MRRNLSLLPNKQLDALICDDCREVLSERARRAADKRTKRSGGRKASCACGTCPLCRKRLAMAEKRRLKAKGI